MKKLFTILLLCVTALTSQASHIMGGEISYENLGGNLYKFRVTLYRDCFGIPAATQVSVNYTSPTCYPGGGQVTCLPTPASPQQIAPACSLVTTTCNGGTFTGIEKWVYEGVVTIPASCPDWTLTYSECCRNAAITNLGVPDTYGATFSATLNNTLGGNNSVNFTSDPVPFLYTNSLNQVNNGAYDVDGDSIVVSLTPPIDDAGNPAPYVSPRTYLDPVTAVSPMSFDPSTGDFYVTPTTAEVDVLAYNVQEYRGGVLVGSVTRDIQITIINGTNNLPALSGINGGTGYILSVCAGDPINFFVASSDADAGQSTVISGISDLPIALTNSGGSTDSVTAFLVTDGTMSRSQPYVLTLTVRDDACPFNGLQSYSYKIYINGCSTDVWPGDANNDLNCNMYDYLNIGLGYGATGTSRAGASLAWVAQPSTDWGMSFMGGSDYKFADCNGDGTIDDNDTTAIILNYGLTHPIRHSAPSNVMLEAASMHFTASSTTPAGGDNVIVSIQLGDQNQIASDVYGIGFRVNFDPTLVDGSQSFFNFLYGQLGNPASDLLVFSRPDWAHGFVDAIAVRKDHQAMNVSGTLAQMLLHISPTAMLTDYTLSFSNILATDASGMLKTYTASPSILRVTQTTGINTVSKPMIDLFPNPARTEIHFSGSNEIQKVSVKDAQGRTVLQTESGWNNRSISIATLPQGVYVAEITSMGEILRKTFCIQR